jgi:50S ribosomal subunit-associated GTPase HflX
MTAKTIIETPEKSYEIEQSDKLFHKKCLIVGQFSMKDKSIDSQIDCVKQLIEFNEGNVIGTMIQRRGISRAKKVGGTKTLNNPMNSATFIGKGKAKELVELSAKTSAETIVFMNNLSVGQKNNLAEMTKCEVIICKISQNIK